MFRVPKHAFAKNPHPPFNEMFSTLPANADGKEGTSSDHPIVLEQISKVDFERFLGVLYPEYVIRFCEVRLIMTYGGNGGFFIIFPCFSGSKTPAKNLSAKVQRYGYQR